MRHTVFIALLLLGTQAFAQTASHVNKEYDVRDLLNSIPENGFEPPSAKAVSAASARLLAAVRAVLRDDPSAKATETAGTLRVTAAAAQHEQVEAALARSRRARSTQIIIEVRFIELRPATIAMMDPDLQQAFDATGFDDTAAVLLTPEQRATLQGEAYAARDASPVPEEAGVPVLLKAVQNPLGRTLSAPRLTTFLGQRASVFIGNETSYVRTMQANPAPNAKDAFVPDIATLETGMFVDLRASCDDALSTISLDVRPKLATLLNLTTEVWPQSPPGQKLYVQIPHVRTRLADQLLTLTSGQSALLRLQDTGETPADAKELLFVLVTPTIVYQQEISPALFDLKP